MAEQPMTTIALEPTERDLLAAAMGQARREATIAVSMVVVADGLRRKLDNLRTNIVLARRRGDEEPPSQIRVVEYEVQILIALLGEHDHGEQLAQKVLAAKADLAKQRRRRASNQALLVHGTTNVVQRPTEAKVLEQLMLHEAKVETEKE